MPTAEPTSRASLIAEVENRLQFNVFVSIFFSTLLYSFFRAIDKPEADAQKALLQWTGVTAAFLVTYVFFQAGKSVIPQRWLKGIDVLVLVGAGFFVLPMLLMAGFEAHWFRIEVLLGVFSLWGVIILASLLNVPVIIGIIVGLHDRSRERERMEVGMSQKTFSLVAGVFFSLVALAHALRIVFSAPVVVANTAIPLWVSWIALVVTGFLGYEGLRLARRTFKRV
jgi:hypothetical protein